MYIHLLLFYILHVSPSDGSKKLSIDKRTSIIIPGIYAVVPCGTGTIVSYIAYSRPKLVSPRHAWYGKALPKYCT